MKESATHSVMISLNKVLSGRKTHIHLVNDKTRHIAFHCLGYILPMVGVLETNEEDVFVSLQAAVILVIILVFVSLQAAVVLVITLEVINVSL